MAETSEARTQIRSRIAERSRRLRLFLSGLGVDFILVSSLPSIRYLCGFTGSSGILLVDSSGSTFFTDSRYTFQAREEVSGARIQIAKQGLLRAAGEVLRRKRGHRRVAFSPASLTVAQKQALEVAAGKGLRWVPDQSAVEKLRCVKDASELALMREAADIISRVFEAVLPLIRPGLTELGLAGEIEHEMKRRGASGASFETIVASGARSAWPHAQPSSKPLRERELVVLDQGAILRGYCSDMTRTVFLGKAPGRVRKLYQAVLDAQQAAKAAIRPGVKAGDVDRAARAVLRRSGLAKYFTHSTGHGLGLEVHEMPRLGRGDEFVLQEGMVVTVEPGVYVEGLGGIRIEDDVVVTAQGAVDLTNASREFLEL